MSDALFKGAARLAVVISTRCLDHPEGHGNPNINTAISIDPGVKALVEAVIEVEDYLREHGDFEPNDKRAELLRAALKLWEHGS